MKRLFAILIVSLFLVGNAFAVSGGRAAKPRTDKKTGKIMSYAYNDTIFGTGGSDQTVITIPFWAQGGGLEVWTQHTSVLGTGHINCYAVPGFMSDGLSLAFLDSAECRNGDGADGAWEKVEVIGNLAIGLDSILIVSVTMEMEQVVTNVAGMTWTTTMAQLATNAPAQTWTETMGMVATIDTFITNTPVGTGDSLWTWSGDNVTVVTGSDVVTFSGTNANVGSGSDVATSSGTNYITEYGRLIPNFTHVRIHLDGHTANPSDTIVYVVVSFIAPDQYVP